MIEIDYGKEAYVKLQQLDKYVKNLEKEQENCTYNELRFELGGGKEIKSLEKSFKVEAFKSGKYYFHFKLRTDLVDMAGIVVNIYVNNVVCFSFVHCLDVEYPFIVEPTLTKGENEIKITMTASSPFTADYLNVTVNGFINYSKVDNRLSMVSYGDTDYVMFLNGKNVEVYTYTTLNNLKSLRSFYNVKDACLLFANALFVFLAVVGVNDALSIKRINLNTTYVDDYPLNISGVTSVSGYHTGRGIEVLFCKLYNLYQGVFSITSNTFNYFNTNKKAVKVYADANVNNCFVIKDINNKCSFVNENSNLINVCVGDKFHVIANSTGYSIEFTDGNKLLSHQISGLKTTEIETVDFCEERLNLVGGKRMKRIRDVISIE